MNRPSRNWASLWAASAILAGAVSLSARPAPKMLQANPDAAEGRQALEQFRRAGLAGGYWLEFDLRVLPRQGAERTVRGQLFGTMAAIGPVSRLVLPGPAGVPSEQRWLFASNRAEAWRAGAGDAAAQAVAGAEVFAPLAGSDIALFDLQMPFLGWTDSVYEGLAKVRGRPAHTFLLYPPAGVAAARPELGAVRVSIDGQFLALVQAEQLDADGKPLKTITVLEVKKLGEQWIVKSVDVRNARTRDKTRFRVGAAALNQRWPEALFTPEGLAKENPTVASAAIQHF
jgi:hypothetical protein